MVCCLHCAKPFHQLIVGQTLGFGEMHVIFLVILPSHVAYKYVGKGIKNGCPCIVEIRGTQGCALVGDPARAVGECRDVAKAQP